MDMAMLLKVQRCSTSMVVLRRSARSSARTIRWRWAQVLLAQLAPQPMQRMRREATASSASDQRPAESPAGHGASPRCRPARRAGLAGTQPTVRSPRPGSAAPRQSASASSSSPAEEHLHPPARSRPPSPPTACAPPAPGRRLAHQRQRPPVEHAAGRREHRLAALDLEGHAPAAASIFCTA
jgi:hypothetical protein